MSDALNWDELLDLFMGDRESVDGLVDLFVEQAEAMIEGLKTAIASQDTNQVQMDAHKLAGSAANIRANEIAAIAKELELAAKEGRVDFAAAPNEVAAIKASLDTIVAEKAAS